MLEGCGGQPFSPFFGLFGKRGIQLILMVSLSLNRLKYSIISSLLYWVGIIPKVDDSFVKTLANVYMPSLRS